MQYTPQNLEDLDMCKKEWKIVWRKLFVVFNMSSGILMMIHCGMKTHLLTFLNVFHNVCWYFILHLVKGISHKYRVLIHVLACTSTVGGCSTFSPNLQRPYLIQFQAAGDWVKFYSEVLWKFQNSIHSFIQTISIAPLEVHYKSEAFLTQHGYCAVVSCRSVTNKCELRICPRSLRVS